MLKKDGDDIFLVDNCSTLDKVFSEPTVAAISAVVVERIDLVNSRVSPTYDAHGSPPLEDVMDSVAFVFINFGVILISDNVLVGVKGFISDVVRSFVTNSVGEDGIIINWGFPIFGLSIVLSSVPGVC